MAARAIICAVIPEREDDSRSSKYLVVAPEDRIVWVANTELDNRKDLKGEGRNRAIAKAKIMSLVAKFEREESQDDKVDILDITDEQLECRSRNYGKCERFPHVVKSSCTTCEANTEAAASLDDLDDDDCFSGVLECWLLEEEVD